MTMPPLWPEHQKDTSRLSLVWSGRQAVSHRRVDLSVGDWFTEISGDPYLLDEAPTGSRPERKDEGRCF